MADLRRPRGGDRIICNRRLSAVDPSPPRCGHTFYVKGNQAHDAAGFVGSSVVLRAPASRQCVLLTRDVPLYIASPNPCVPADELDATHCVPPVRALAVDKAPSDGRPEGVLGKLAGHVQSQAKTRLRLTTTFAEPANSTCGSPTRRGGDWRNGVAHGMVTKVLKSAGIDPEVLQLRVGVGMERTLLLRSDINDMHDLVEGDVRFSEQFVMGE